MGEVYSLVHKAKVKFPNSKIVLSGVLRQADVSWRCIGALNDRYDWILRTLGVTFLDPNSWLEEWDFTRDRPHINHRGARRLGQLYCRVSGLRGKRKKMDWYLTLVNSIEGASERTRKVSIQENPTVTWKTMERVEVEINPTRRESEVESAEEREISTGAQQMQGKSLVLLQVNCRSILNKTLEFWNLVDTYNSDVI